MKKLELVLNGVVLVVMFYFACLFTRSLVYVLNVMVYVRTAEAWKTVFLLLALIYLFVCFIYYLVKNVLQSLNIKVGP